MKKLWNKQTGQPRDFDDDAEAQRMLDQNPGTWTDTDPNAGNADQPAGDTTINPRPKPGA